MRVQGTLLVIGTLLLISCAAAEHQELPASSSSSSSVNSSAEAEAFIVSPLPNSVVLSPLTIKGKALNSWFFEGSLPVKITDADGNVLDQQPGQAKSDWMTPGTIEFEAQLNFSTIAKTGFIVIANDNPSGDPERDKQIKIPVLFR